MKRLLFYLCLSATLAFIVTTGSYEINAYRHAGPLVTDGSGPIPPFPPKSAVTLLADGSGPIPPFPPKSAVTLLADGSGPIPPFPPKSLANTSV